MLAPRNRAFWPTTYRLVRILLPKQWFQHLVLPWFTLAILYIGVYAQVLRSSVLEAMSTDAVRTAYVPCLWAGMTSAIGQISLLTSSLAPVRDFGLYSAAGTLISLAVTLYGLPALLQVWPGKPPRPEELGSVNG